MAAVTAQKRRAAIRAEPKLTSALIWQNFVLAIKSKASRKTYISIVDRYLQYLRGKNCNRCDSQELVRLTKQDSRVLEQGLVDFLSLEMKGTVLATKRTAFAAAKLFYSMNDVTLNWKKISKYIKGDKENGQDKAYAIPQIREILKVADKRMKVAVLILASAGIRKAGLLGLRRKDLIKVERCGIYCFIVYSDAKSDMYVTFCTPECAEAIDAYFLHRHHCGEELTPESPVIRNDFDIENLYAAKEVRPLTEPGFDHVLKKLLWTAGVRKPVHTLEGQRLGSIRHEIKMAHGFRKFFLTSCRRAKVDPILKEKLAGHRTAQPGSGTTTLELIYDRPEDDELLQEYMKAIPELTISEEYRLKKQLQEKQKVDEKTLKQTIAQMVEQYLAKRQQLSQAYPSMSPEEFAQEIEQVEKLNPLERLGLHRDDLGLPP